MRYPRILGSRPSVRRASPWYQYQLSRRQILKTNRSAPSTSTSCTRAWSSRQAFFKPFCSWDHPPRTPRPHWWMRGLFWRGAMPDGLPVLLVTVPPLSPSLASHPKEWPLKFCTVTVRGGGLGGLGGLGGGGAALCPTSTMPPEPEAARKNQHSPFAWGVILILPRFFQNPMFMLVAIASAALVHGYPERYTRRCWVISGVSRLRPVRPTMSSPSLGSSLGRSASTRLLGGPGAPAQVQLPPTTVT